MNTWVKVVVFVYSCCCNGPVWFITGVSAGMSPGVLGEGHGDLPYVWDQHLCSLHHSQHSHVGHRELLLWCSCNSFHLKQHLNTWTSTSPSYFSKWENMFDVIVPSVLTITSVKQLLYNYEAMITITSQCRY